MSKNTILYVEDDKETLEILSVLLKEYFEKVYIAKNGAEGIDEYKKHMPNVVLSDVNMPKMDGFTMAKKIKKINKNQKIILISAYSGEDLNEKIKEAHIDYFLNKPVDFEYLLEILKNI